MAKSSKKSSSPWSRVQAAKKAVKEGRKGASARLDKAIKAYATASCSVKAAPKKRKSASKRTRRTSRKK